jgi:hypothetical protein
VRHRHKAAPKKTRPQIACAQKRMRPQIACAQNSPRPQRAGAAHPSWCPRPPRPAWPGIARPPAARRPLPPTVPCAHRSHRLGRARGSCWGRVVNSTVGLRAPSRAGARRGSGGTRWEGGFGAPYRKDGFEIPHRKFGSGLLPNRKYVFSLPHREEGLCFPYRRYDFGLAHRKPHHSDRTCRRRVQWHPRGRG